MTPKLAIRTFSNDQYVLDKIFYSNFYKLKGFKDTDRKPVVVDIGAHCGYFTFSALALGAKKVYAFEPFIPNYKMLIHNVSDNTIGHVIPYQLGVYVAPLCLTFNYPQLTNNSFFDFATIGLDANVDSVEFCKCCVLPLDTLLEHYIGEQVDVLKINIGYAEGQILAASNLLSQRVTHICGELVTDVEGKGKFKQLLSSKGFQDIEFLEVIGEEGKSLFHASRTDRKEMFI